METTETSAQQETNAALAALAAAGNSYALGQLWEINKGLLRSMLWKWYPAHKAMADAHGMTADDFEQEGFFAVQHAAQTYKPEKGSFTTWLSASMRQQIQKSLCNGHKKIITDEEGKRHVTSADPLNHCTSLDLPLDDEDGNSATLADLQEDTAAAAALDAVEDAIFSEELSAAIGEALDKLTEREADIIRRRYYQGHTLREVGAAYDVAWSRAQQIEKAAFRKLRLNPKLCKFHDDIIQHHAYNGTGFKSWQESGSVEEHLIEYLESKHVYF